LSGAARLDISCCSAGRYGRNPVGRLRGQPHAIGVVRDCQRRGGQDLRPLLTPGNSGRSLFKDIRMVMGSLKRAAARAASALFVFTAFALFAGPASADFPRPWALGMQAPASEVKDRIDNLHDLLLVIITLITLFVLALLVYVMVRFRASAHPTPTRTT